MADIDVVAENLAELLTNTVDMAAVFYDIFLNPQPLDINIQMYDDNNQLITVTIPNRAKDRITSYVGEGSPEGVVEAPIGSVYVDTLTSTVYYKVSGSDSYGWNAVISQSLMETFIRTYLEARGYITTSSLHTYLVTHEYVNIPSLETYLNVNGYIRGKNLDSIPALDLTSQLMVVTEDETDFLKNVSFGNLLGSAISSDENNGLTRGTDNKLFVQEILPATVDRIGGVKVGNGLSVEDDGTLSAVGRNIGEIVGSTLPLKDAGLHLLDGSLIERGSYSGFVDYIAGLYSADPNASYFMQSSYRYDITIIGDLINTNGVLSGFSVNNYATVPGGAFAPGDNPWEMVYKFTTSSDVTNRQFISAGNSYKYGFGDISIESSHFLLALSHDGNSAMTDSGAISGSYTVLTDTTYWIKLSFDGSTYKLEYSTDGINYTVDITYNSTTTVFQGSTVLIGVDYYTDTGIDAPFTGTLDLKGCYINISDVEWWSGAALLVSAEENWQQSVTDYGVCGKFVYDSVNNTVRLPKITGIIEGTTDLTALGDLVEAGSPNITAAWVVDNNNGGWTTGATYIDGSNNQGATGDGGVQYRCAFDASRSSSIYGNSNTVQPQTIKAFYYIVIANSTKTDIQVDIDEIATDLNGKADVDLTNTTDQAKILMSAMGMPSDTYTDLVLGTTGAAYTAPANGWFYVKTLSTGSGQEASITNKVDFASSRSTGSGQYLYASTPALKGDIVNVWYNGTVQLFRFYYAKGSESEAS